MSARSIAVIPLAGALALAPSTAGAASSGGLWDALRKATKAGTTVAQATARLDENQERSIGRAVAANLIARFGLDEDPGLTAYVNTLGNVLASQSRRPELPYRFAILDTDEINAFAAPGGYVFVSRGTLAEARDESELAGVLAHEIVHVAERHGAKTIEASYHRKVVASGLAQAAASRSGADPRLVAAFGQLTDELTDVLLTKGLSRQLELDADRGALELLGGTAYDPEGLVRFLDRLAASVPEARMATLSRTHPPPADRVAELQRALAGGTVLPRPEGRWPDLYAQATASLRP